MTHFLAVLLIIGQLACWGLVAGLYVGEGRHVSRARACARASPAALSAVTFWALLLLLLAA